MAARKNRTSLSDDWRQKIQATQIINRLSDHVFGKNDMTPTQINAAKILLAKVAPDLKQTELTGIDGGPIEHTISAIKLIGVKPDGSRD